MTESRAIQSALKKVEAQKDNFGFMDRFDVEEHWAVRKALEKQIPKKPILCMNETTGMFVDYANGQGEFKTQMNNWWKCPCCNSVVGQRVVLQDLIHDQKKKKFCENCGQKIEW